MSLHQNPRGLGPWKRLPFSTAIALASAASALIGGAEETPRALTYEQDIRPIFRAHCFDCHGATEDFKGGLDLRQVRRMRSGGESGPAIDESQPETSYLLERVESGEMPPGDNRLPPADIETLRKWLAAGAPTARPEPESIGPGLGVTPEERSYWFFQPLKLPEPPTPSAGVPDARIRTPIDALIRQQHPAADFSSEATRATLIKRACFDLLGLPPTLEQQERWLNDSRPDWYDHLLTELLNSPHYGERWGRHWLDVAGYADSEGFSFSVADAPRSWAWKYRDWVIRSLNNDKPLDQFVTEQLAGDELSGAPQGDWTPEQIELLTAGGFLRMAADGTGSGGATPEARNQVMTDTLKIVGTSLLGLSIQCAQCHDHRYDPIPQTDYYALRAVFEPALDWQAWKAPAARQISLYTAADRAAAAELEAAAQQIAVEKAAEQAKFMQQALDQELEKFAEPLRTQLREAYQASGDKRTEEQKKLLALHPSVNITPGVLYQYLPKAAEELKKFDARIEETRSRKPKEEFVRALVEPPNHAPDTKLFDRGDFRAPKQSVLPGGLSVLDGATFPANDPQRPTTGRRLAFAQWLTRSDNPLLARVIANRVWLHHFGAGIVATPGDFGKLGAPPTDPELLDLLASELIREGWSLKKLHRLIMTSTVWRQSCGDAEEAASDAAEASWAEYSRKPLIRLDAEVIRDRMLAASGQLDPQLYGPPVAIKDDDIGQVVVDGPQTRRSLYIQVRRSRPVAMLKAFDAPVMETNCEVRPSSTVATQSLMLLNGEFILQQAAQLADRGAREAAPLTAEQMAALPPIPPAREHDWRYGYGEFDEASQRVTSFTPLGHWTGTQWQGGPQLPDPAVGWVLLHANGGHPDGAGHSAIRRWIAPEAGQLSITGALSHGSPNGNGVRGRIVSSRAGLLGAWTAHNGAASTDTPPLEVEAGETIDFVTDNLGDTTSDSFSWPATLKLRAAGGERSIAAATQFCGPPPAPEALAGQIVRIWQRALCRQPSPEELSEAVGFVAGQIHALEGVRDKLPAGRTPVQQAMTNMCQSILSCNEFLYVE